MKEPRGKTRRGFPNEIPPTPTMAISGFTRKVTTPEGANRLLTLSRLGLQMLKLHAAGTGHSGRDALTPAAPHSQQSPLENWLCAPHLGRAHAQDGTGEEECGFPVACPRGHESLRGAERKTHWTNWHVILRAKNKQTNNPTEYILIHLIH